MIGNSAQARNGLHVFREPRGNFSPVLTWFYRIGFFPHVFSVRFERQVQYHFISVFFGGCRYVSGMAQVRQYGKRERLLDIEECFKIIRVVAEIIYDYRHFSASRRFNNSGRRGRRGPFLRGRYRFCGFFSLHFLLVNSLRSLPQKEGGENQNYDR